MIVCVTDTIACVDVLSDVVTTMRTGRPHSARVTHRAPFGRRFPAVDAAGFHVVLQGLCWLFPADGDPVALAPGDVVFLPRGQSHGLADSPGTTLADAPAALTAVEPTDGDPATAVTLCGAYTFDRARSHPVLGDLPETVHVPARAGRHAALRAVVDLLDGEVTEAGPGRDAMLCALLDALLLHILRAWFAERGDTGWAAALHDPAVAAALRAVHDDPARPWTVATLAARAGLSRAAFARRFTALVGQPPLAYLTWWRMTLAARTLRDADTPIAAVARQAGYTSEFAFAAAFKREHGHPPGRFRRGVRVP